MDYEKAYKEALERARKIKDGKDEWRYSDLAEITPALTEIFPELRESEDERMMREFNDWLCEEIECRTNDLRDEKDRRTLNMLCFVLTKVKDWLEKQKEQKPISTEDMPYVADEHFFEREPADSFKYRLAEYMTKNCKKGEGPYGYSYSISSESILQMAKEELIKRGELKEQKPELVQHPPITYTYPSDASRDERLKAALLALLNSDLLKVKEGGYFTKQDLIEWVERIPTDRPAWSEEDEILLVRTINRLETLNFHGISGKEIRESIDWLKNLPIGWKPTEEQMDALAYAIQLLDDGLSPKAAKAGEELESLREQLKKL